MQGHVHSHVWHAASLFLQVCHVKRTIHPSDQELAFDKLRKHPTIPPGAVDEEIEVANDRLKPVDEGHLWPRVFCAFKGCNWTSDVGDEECLHRHLEESHAQDLEPILPHMLRGEDPAALLGVYHEAIAVKCRSQAPLAGCSIDRGALRAYTSACSNNNTEALICFSCACIYVHLADLPPQKQDIQWTRPVQRRRGTNNFNFLGLPAAQGVDLLDFNAFLERYDQLNVAGKRLTDHETFDGWTLAVKVERCDEPAKILCCPEANGSCGAPACPDKNAYTYVYICVCVEGYNFKRISATF